jgi:hypothetical protein
MSHKALPMTGWTTEGPAVAACKSASRLRRRCAAAERLESLKPKTQCHQVKFCPHPYPFPFARILGSEAREEGGKTAGRFMSLAMGTV